MSTLHSPVAISINRRNKAERGHRFRVWLAALAAFGFVAALTIYGADFYLLPLSERPFSDKYQLLKPGGIIGLKLGIIGTVLFFIIFLYALRKVIPWLGRIGTAKHWMDFHVIAGVTAPVVIAFHASFKFRGIAGVAFWIMLAVALSGIVGRYLYSQIPRSITAAELSMNELRDSEQELTQNLTTQSVYSSADLEAILGAPSADHLKKIGPLSALVEMFAMNLRLPLQVAALRRQASTFGGKLRTLGGLLPSPNPEAEHVVELVRRKASLSRRIIFLDHTRRLFHLWHVIHRPFSYTFAVLAVIHIAVVMGLGFMGLGFR